MGVSRFSVLVILMGWIWLSFSSCKKDVRGCQDQQALNHDPGANISSENCEYASDKFIGIWFVEYDIVSWEHYVDSSGTLQYGPVDYQGTDSLIIKRGDVNQNIEFVELYQSYHLPAQPHADSMFGDSTWNWGVRESLNGSAKVTQGELVLRFSYNKEGWPPAPSIRKDYKGIGVRIN